MLPSRGAISARSFQLPKQKPAPVGAETGDVLVSGWMCPTGPPSQMSPLWCTSPAALGEGRGSNGYSMTPSCFMSPTRSDSYTRSVTSPSSTVAIMTAGYETDLPVGGMPSNFPSCVAVTVT